ncbi:phage late control D family protein [Sulfurovum sp. bin170]|uniref:phage late control D family protein n=1 Tax=Sulfurovum sp. bin170 TaxID=2695268 RepID=UPI0013E0D3BD|nr:contractile injection system protein, VgrG/Pvc8 family [Sulfurovum sp. bin170]NEW61369.1 phage late control D family protein [Sulfurovum sp. bin170]
MSSLASKNQEFNAPEVEVLIDGELISKSHLYVTNLEVDLSSEMASLFSMTITKTISDTLEITEPWIFKMGASVKIRIGYLSEFVDVMDGVISSVTYHYGDDKHLSIEVEGCDLLFLLMKKYNQRSFSEMSDSEVASAVIANYGLESDIEDSGVIYNHIQQDHESDFSFLARLAKRCGFEFHSRGETICFKSPAVDRATDEVFTFGVTPLQISCRHDITHLFESVKTQGWDVLNREAIAEESTLDEVGSVESSWESASASLDRLGLSDISYPLSENYENSESAKSEADAMMRRFAYTFVELKGSIIGVPTLAPSTVIELKGFCREHNGKYYLTRVIHRIGEEGFTTHFEMRGDRIHESL